MMIAEDMHPSFQCELLLNNNIHLKSSSNRKSFDL